MTVQNRIFWSNVGVDVQTALGDPISIKSISKANPGVVTYEGTPANAPANGDYFIFQVQGMHQINERIFRVAAVDTASKSFTLEGEDTSPYDNFVSGSARLVTFDASFSSVQSLQVSGGEYEKTDLTTIHDAVKKQAPTVASPLTISMTNYFDLTDPGFAECNKAYKSKTTRAILLRFGTGAKMAFVGYVGAAGIPTGQAQGAVMTPVSVDVQNIPSIWAN